MNKMPKLKAGMIIKLKSKASGDLLGPFVYINNSLAFHVHNGGFVTNIANDPSFPIVAIYNPRHNASLELQGKNLKSRLIWERKSDTQRKIESIEATIESAMEELNELKQLSE
jgi:hypothetical protein